jgi:hypothetical protein
MANMKMPLSRFDGDLSYVLLPLDFHLDCLLNGHPDRREQQAGNQVQTANPRKFS